MSSILKHFYTLQEIAMALNFSDEEINTIASLAKFKDLNLIIRELPKLKRFRPYIRLINVQKKEVFVIPVKVFDLYIKTGLLTDFGSNNDIPDTDKKEYWQYQSSDTFEISTKDNWEFGLNYFKQNSDKVEAEDIWDIFQAGCSRMNYYQKEDTTITQRIKYALMEYMVRRPQFFTTDDFVDNPLLHKEYSKEKKRVR